jgi:hypothetical protein
MRIEAYLPPAGIDGPLEFVLVVDDRSLHDAPGIASGFGLDDAGEGWQR